MGGRYNLRQMPTGEVDPILDRLATLGLTVLVEQKNRGVVPGGASPNLMRTSAGTSLGFASDRTGLDPLRHLALGRPDILDGADVALPSVGLGVAYLLVGAKVGRVYARVMTHEAHKAFEAEGIEHASHERVKRLAADDALGALDERARDAPTMLAFIEELRQRG